MKLQILDEGVDSSREGEQFVSFLNELDTGIRAMLMNPGSIPRPLFHFLTRFPQRQKKLSSEVFHFFNELEIRKLCSKTFVSFFNEVSSETQKIDWWIRQFCYRIDR
jgi:hypothetical protein